MAALREKDLERIAGGRLGIVAKLILNRILPKGGSERVEHVFLAWRSGASGARFGGQSGESLAPTRGPGLGIGESIPELIQPIPMKFLVDRLLDLFGERDALFESGQTNLVGLVA